MQCLKSILQVSRLQVSRITGTEETIADVIQEKRLFWPHVHDVSQIMGVPSI